MMNRILFIFLLDFFILGRSWAETSDYACGPLQNAYGPYDYRSDKDKLPIHFYGKSNPEYEFLSNFYPSPFKIS